MSLKWWEKTVEYFFIRNCIGDSMVIAPLDGKQERAGDSIFSKDNKCVLIEFKNCADSLSSEINKFDDYEKAKKHFLDKDSHHFLVYGGIFKNKESKRVFGVKAQTYFTRNTVNSIELMLSAGLNFDDFFSYIKKFTSFKKVSDGSSGGFGLESYGLVAGINSNNQIVECISLDELGNKLGLDLVPELTPEPPAPTKKPSFRRFGP